ncbi:hypothetical protein JVT61DRAFT_9503 [Boletus reticuloceps]|uniref:Fungal-type protein kinase domain-containing protein n=1 Tax=Boletus reticuloceps TaxID=495285 RepID=A0A8I2YHJ5_9AGAM|nr:hypothetical protein JVT61DRAFT_9503 [Boletus reticuloceps]
MDRLRDIRRTTVQLREQDSITFLAYIYPERFLLPENGTTEGLFRILQSKGHYKGATKGKWAQYPVVRHGQSQDSDRENKLAKFLNSVRAAVHSAYGISCFEWDAKSTTKPLDGAYAAGEPGIACYFRAPDGDSNHSWQQVVTFCEVKTPRANPKREKESFAEVASKASCLLGAQDGRHSVSCIRILGSSIYLTIFHRSGSISTCPFDINSSPLQFLHILMGISFSDYSNIGFDVSIRWDTLDKDSESDRDDSEHSNSELREPSCMDDPGITHSEEDSESEDPAEPSDDEDAAKSEERAGHWGPGGKWTKWLEIVDKHGKGCKISLRSILAISDSLLGPGTTVWEGEVDSSPVNERVVVKDTWIDPLRKYTEGMILHILEQHGIEGVPTLVSEQQVKTPHRDPEYSHIMVNQSTHFLLSALPRDSTFRLRVLSRLVSQPRGKLILGFSSLGELLVAFLDCIVTHKNALEVAGVLHRDVSPANLFLALARNRTDHSVHMSHLPDEAQERLCEKIRNLKWRGILGDWGYAVPVATSSAITSSDTTSDVDVSWSDAPPMSPIDADGSDPSVHYDDRVPARKIGSHDAPTLVPVSDLTANDDIVLLMGTDNPDDDPRKTIDLCPLYRTGTWPWMSAQLTMAGPGQPVVHDPLHDLESFFYVLVGICIYFDGPSKHKSENDLVECYDKFFDTSESSILKTIAIQSDLTWIPFIVKHIHPFFEPVIPLLTLLRAEIILPLATNEQGHFYRKTSCNHDIFIKHILTILSELRPEHWDDKPESDASRWTSSGITAARPESGPPTPPLLLVPPTAPKDHPPGCGIIRSDPGLPHQRSDQCLRRNRESGSDDLAPSSRSKRPRLEVEAN